MAFTFDNNSLVIVANQHNPTVISENFLISSGIIESAEAIDRNNLVITPAVSQVFLKEGIKISVEPNKMTIHQEDIGDGVYEIGRKYCESLPHIKCTAIGINFELALDQEVDIENWFSKFNLVDYKNSHVNGIDFEFDLDEEKPFKCHVKVYKAEDSSGKIRFNYHHPLNEPPLKDIDFDFKEKWKEYTQYCEEFTNKLF
jgi:hypothetical protein